ncbi:MAG: hypothetical protein JSW03_06780 [Candidatus Eiseniibacteriota bacterium]|nr:MAG: hypothetical protein JSW03_06780 [Candidatus Eisenbacteria bacterium]
MVKSRIAEKWLRVVTLAVATSAILAACPLADFAGAQVTGISYTLAPVVEGIRFEDDAALKDAALFGGKLGFGFGEFVELNGLYVVGPDLRTDFGNLGGFDEATASLLRQLPSRSTDFHRFGGELKFNMGRGSVFPFVTLGTGVVRFDPQDLNDSKMIYLGGSLGLQYSYMDRYTIVLQATDLSYRYNPGSTLLSADDITYLGLTPDDFQLVSVNNLGASVGVKFYLGGSPQGELTELDRALQDQLSRGWGGIGFRLEPAAGEIDFHESLGLRKNQRFVGLSAGFDLGPYAGLRGFYWRGTETDHWTKFDEIHAYGGELKLAFTQVGTGLTPYIMIGGGYADVRDGYVGNGVVVPDDHPFAFGGLGLVLPMGSGVNLDAGVRSVLMSTAGVDNVSDPAQVEASTMFTVGVSFGLGGRSAQLGYVFGQEMQASRAERERLASDVTTAGQEIDRLRSRVDSLAVMVSERDLARRDSLQVPAPAPVEKVAVEAPVARPDTLRRAEQVPGERPFVEEVRRDTGRWMTVPVPEEGELYLRFGKPGGVSIETVEGEALTYYLDPTTGALVMLSPTTEGTEVAPPSPMAVAPSGLAGQGASPDQIEEIVRRVLRDERTAEEGLPADAEEAAMLERLESRLESRLLAMETALSDLKRTPAPPPEIVGEPRATTPVVVDTRTQQPQPEPTVVVDPEKRVVEVTRTPSTRFTGLAPLTGYNIDSPHQWLIGVRADFVHQTRPFRLTPELVMGFGDDEVTTNVNLNWLYDLGLEILEGAYPYGGIGLGFLDRDELELVLNLIVGCEVQAGESKFFLEYVNQDFFDNNRILAGYRFVF